MIIDLKFYKQPTFTNRYLYNNINRHASSAAGYT